MTTSNWVIGGLLLSVIVVLFYGLVALLKGRQPQRLVRSLTVRIGLSVFLFVLLVLGWKLGLWTPKTPAFESVSVAVPSPWLTSAGLVNHPWEA
ncbi:MAG: DUF2909 domain-containing protein [Gammaproteobacteria bacterium]|nr:DUF2909 domain-containing protein [Gammaproteobacteria bacterium]